MNQYSKCECHECTQARWRMYGGGGFQYTWPTKAEALTGQNVPNLPSLHPIQTPIGPVK